MSKIMVRGPAESIFGVHQHPYCPALDFEKARDRKNMQIHLENKVCVCVHVCVCMYVCKHTHTHKCSLARIHSRTQTQTFMAREVVLLSNSLSYSLSFSCCLDRYCWKGLWTSSPITAIETSQNMQLKCTKTSRTNASSKTQCFLYTLSDDDRKNWWY